MATACERISNEPTKVEAQLIGTVRFCCPNCDLMQVAKIARQSWRVRCTNRHCRRVWGIGLAFYVMDNPGKRSRHTPPDVVLGRYQDRQPVNQLHDSCPAQH
jgi:hypothetical protein